MRTSTLPRPLLVARRCYLLWLLSGISLAVGLPQLMTASTALGPLWLCLIALPAACLLASLLPRASQPTLPAIRVHPARQMRRRLRDAASGLRRRHAAPAALPRGERAR